MESGSTSTAHLNIRCSGALSCLRTWCSAGSHSAKNRCKFMRDGDSISICMRSTLATRATVVGTGGYSATVSAPGKVAVNSAAACRKPRAASAVCASARSMAMWE